MADSLISGVERAFDGLGLMTGEYAIPKRMVVGALAGAFVVTYFKPGAMFEGGKPRPWVLFATKENELSGTATPWWIVPLAGAFIGGVLI